MIEHPSTLAIIRYHWYYPNNHDPYYNYNISENMARNNYYANNYSPHLFIDGGIDASYNYGTWESRIATESEVSSPLIIFLSGSYDSTSRSGVLNVRVIAEDNPEYVNLKLRVALVESGIFWTAPNGSQWHNETFRDMVSSIAGESLVIAQGESRDFTFNFSAPNPIDADSSYLVAFVQSDQSRMILQAAKSNITLLDNTTTLTPFTLSEPADNAVLASATPSLYWHPTLDMDSTYTIYYRAIWSTDELFTNPDSSVLLSDTSYSIAENLNRSQAYFWKVEAYNYQGRKLRCNQPREFYIDGYPSLPSIVSPSNGAESDSDTYFSWTICHDPDPVDTVTYSLQADNDPEFGSPEINFFGISAPNNPAAEDVTVFLRDMAGYENLVEGQSYFWRVRSDDKFGLSSEFTDRTNYFVYFMDVNNPPNPPASGFFPVNGEEVSSIEPIITWDNGSDFDGDDSTSALSYIIWISTDSLWGENVNADTTLPGINQFSPAYPLEDNSHYFYRLKTLDDGGLTSNWTATQNFWTNLVNTPPEPFMLLNPADSVIQVDYFIKFSWRNSVDLDPHSSFSFTLDISNDPLFSYVLWSQHYMTDTALTMATELLGACGPLFWRVSAIDDDGLRRIGGIPEGRRYLMVLPPGDSNANGVTNGLDATYLVNYLKGMGPAPEPILAGDANGNCTTNGLDVTYLVNYLKGIGEAPIRGACESNLILQSDKESRQAAAPQ